ncbi:MAG: DUF4340 domain-containing protein [Enhygromyxa sp.]
MSRPEPDAPRPGPRPGSTRLSVPRPIARSLGSMRPRLGTIVALAVAVTAVTLTWADPFAEPDDSVLLVNNRTGARRVFPTLVDADPGKATIELLAPGKPPVRIVPAPDGGHQLIADDVLLGPVAADDFDGLWSSLRLANATRKISGGGDDLGVGKSGVIRISSPDSSITLSLGNPTTGGGVYASFESGGEVWVVEAELLSLVQQRPETWLSTRLVPVDAGLVTGLAWGDELTLGRSDDGFWRVRSGAPPALLSNEAVDVQLRRLLRAKLDPFVDRDVVASESLRPWLVITALDGSSRALLVGGECPGHPERRLVDRGPGQLGCVPAKLLERWPLHDPDAGMIETRLVPHEYGRIVELQLEQPSARKLVRRGGEWFYAEGDAGLVPVAEAEVRRWYQALHRLEVALVERPDGEGQGEGQGEGAGPGEALAFEPSWTLAVHADTGEILRVACGLDADPLCVRDGGLDLRVLGELPRNLVFEAETFAERRLTTIGPGEIRSVEILPPSEDPRSITVRQSVHADMGAWELDAPTHPDDSGAIDLDRLETVLWALRQLRAEAWVDDPGAEEAKRSAAPRGPTDPSVLPLRRLAVEVVPAQGLRRSVVVTLYPDCIVEVDDHPPAAISSAQCEALSRDLFFDDPLRFWLERSRGVEIADAEGEQRVFVRRRDQQFVTDDGRSIDDEALARRIADWIEWRSAGLREGDPPTPVEWTLDVRRDFGPPAQVEIGEGWVRLRGAGWYYQQRDPAAVPSEASLDDEALDVGAIELD